MNIIYPSEGKLFANVDETELYSALILAENDSIDNYHEVDDLTVVSDPDEPVVDDSQYPDEIILTPDENGMISYEQAAELVKRINNISNKLAKLSMWPDGARSQTGAAMRYASV